MLGTDGKMHSNGRPHREAEQCWNDLDYFTVHPYRVLKTNDVIASKGLRANADPSAKRDWEVVRMRDAHVVLREEPLMAHIEAALNKIDTNRG